LDEFWSLMMRDVAGKEVGIDLLDS